MNRRDNVVCRTSTNSQTLNLKWVIDDIDDHYARKIDLASDKCTFMGTTWRMHLNFDPITTLSIRLLTFEKINFQEVKIVACILNDKNKVITSDCWMGPISRDSKINFILQNDTIKAEPLHSSRNSALNQWPSFTATNGQLRLLCSITIFDTPCFTSIIRNYRQESFAKFQQDITALLANNKSKDCVLSVQGKDISAHQLILSARSPVLSALLKKSEQSDLKRKLTIEGIEYETMLEVVNFIYSGKSDKIGTMSKVLLEAANKFDIQDLKSMCQDFLITTINTENVCDLFIFGELSNDSNLKNGAKKFISVNFAKVRSTTSFLDMANHHPHLLVELLKDFEPTCLS